MTPRSWLVAAAALGIPSWFFACNEKFTSPDALGDDAAVAMDSGGSYKLSRADMRLVRELQ